MLKSKLKKNSGFTLLETLVYAFVFVVILVAFISIIVASVRSVNRLRITANITNGATTSLERMSRDIRLATSVDLINTTFDVNPGELTINIVDPDTEVTTVEYFYISSNDLLLQIDGGTATSLLPEGISVDSLIFRQITSGDTQGVKMEVSIHDDRNTSKIESFYTSVIFRQAE